MEYKAAETKLSLLAACISKLRCEDSYDRKIMISLHDWVLCPRQTNTFCTYLMACKERGQIG